jgi:RNA polymerase sigma-70 factor, ECF subfamily
VETQEPVDITQLLRRVSSGDAEAEHELLPLVYAELRRIAGLHVNRESSENTLQATALVHEAYIRLNRHPVNGYQDRTHFFALASRVMRRVLIENARQRSSGKRGGNAVTIALDESIPVSSDSLELVLAVNEALDRLEVLAPRQARIVEMRYFAGLSLEEIATILDLSLRTVHREWAVARAWLRGELS